MCAIVLVTLSIASGGSEAATTYVDGDWSITETTTLRDGTWVVNGTVSVSDCTLTLDRAELVINAALYSKNRILVDASAGFEAHGSVVRGANVYGLSILTHGSVLLDNTTLLNMDIVEYGGIYQLEGSLLVDHCTLDGGSTAIYSYASLTARSSRFLNCTTGIQWGLASYDPATIVVDGCTLTNQGPTGIGLYLTGPGTEDAEREARVVRCQFQGLGTAIYCNEFRDYGTIVIEENVARDCEDGCYVSSGGRAVTMHRNRWEGMEAYGVYLNLITSYPVNFNNETVVGGYYGVFVSGTYRYQTVRDSVITGARIGIYASSTNVDVFDSTIRSVNYELYMSGSGYIHIFHCNHTRSGYVTSTYGEISEPVTVNITSVTWQDGTPITTGVINFQNETGAYLSLRDNTDPAPVLLPLWKLTRYDNVTGDTAVGVFSTDGTAFKSEPFEYRDLTRYDLVIYDNSTPEATIDHPLDGERFDRNGLVVRGDFTERGSGLGTIRVTHDGIHWTVADLFDNGTWRARLEDLPEGLLAFTVNITDRTGNSAETRLRNITIDTVWPFIEVLVPGKYVRSTPMQLVGRTEPGAMAWVNYRPVEVMPDGMFSAMLTFIDYDNLVEIRVVDVVGHENQTSWRILYDPDPPILKVDAPSDGEWVLGGSVTVTGSTDPDALVFVNGQKGVAEYGTFSIEVPVQEGPTLLVIVAEDLAGNRVTVTRTVHVDLTPPELTVLSPVTGTVTNRDRVSLTGKVIDISEVSVRAGQMHASVFRGNWSVEVPLEPGTNEITITATDLSGNSVERTITVVLDTVAPTFRILVTVDDVTYGLEELPACTSSGTLVWDLQVYERVIVSVSGGIPFPSGPGNLSRNLILEEGSNQVTIRVSDLAGNEAEAVVLAIQRDDAPPELTVEGLAGIQRTAEGHFLVQGTTEAGCQVTVNGIPAPVLDNGVFAVMVPLEEGPNSLQVVSRDPAGNTASKTVQVVYELKDDESASISWPPVLAGALCGLIAGMFASLAVGRRRRVGPPPQGAPDDGEGAGAVDAVGPAPPERTEPPPSSQYSQEVPGQLPPDTSGDREEWEMV